jgi:hypothetical protein
VDVKVYTIEIKEVNKTSDTEAADRRADKSG